MIAKFFKFVFGTANQRSLNKLHPIVNKINEFENDMLSLTSDELKSRTSKLKELVVQGESLENILPEAFAMVREASNRVIGQRPFDVQMIGGIVLNQGKICEMKTGEGKTLTATLPLFLNSLTGKGTHLITVNDYLASRDAEWMGQIYKALGQSVGALKNDMHDGDRKKIYNCDIVYGTNSEFGFDYLRDNMKFSLSDYVQRDLFFAIVDEADSILIDEARTPLIISGSSDEESIGMYRQVNDVIKKLVAKEDYEVDEKERNSFLTENGIDRVQKGLLIENLYAQENIKYLHHVNQSLRAHALFKIDVDYVVYDGQVFIVDEFTGRILPGRRYNDGLHQAIEAKEGVEIQEESQTLASITIQNYFRLYKKISGMTGTALTEAEEFHKIYKLDVVSIPTNLPMIREDKHDFVFLSESAKFKNIVKDIKERYKNGQPVLIGTVAVETSERLSNVLQKEGILHSVLNAKYHEQEAEIIAHAGEVGKITIATNMAGRGTDIKLSEEAKKRGGLYILGTERHESRRIDNQLRGRSGRQGDRGESRFYISLDDSLIRRFGGESMKVWMQRTGMKEDEIIEDKMVSGIIESAQEKIEKHNFEARKQLIEYDDVLNQQRVIIYGLRKRIIAGGDSFVEVINELLKKVLENIVRSFVENSTSIKKKFIPDILTEIKQLTGTSIEEIRVLVEGLNRVEAFVEKLHSYFYKIYSKNILISDIDNNLKDEDVLLRRTFILEKQKWVILEILNQNWRQHIVDLENIREGIGLRGYGQKTPLIEYKNEAFSLFKNMVENTFKIIVASAIKNGAINVDHDEIKRRLEAFARNAIRSSSGDENKTDLVEKNRTAFGRIGIRAPKKRK
jgi:preprotein translocase subunit SecA